MEMPIFQSQYSRRSSACLVPSAMRVLYALAKFGYLIYQLIGTLPFSWRDRKRVIYQLDQVGVNSIPIVMLVGLFAGAIIAWQAAYQFKGFVSLNIMGGQVVRVIMMEMAPVLTALVISGRVGSSMTAEIGSMKLSDQIAALQMLSIDPVRYLVMPRFLGLALMMPILTFFSMLIAVLGSYLVTEYFLDLTHQVFFASMRAFFDPVDLLGGLVKASVFGMIIALVGCYMGISTEGGARGLGQATIQSFVVSAICILASDFLLWIILF